MRVLHTGDIHVCDKHGEWVDKALTCFVDYARENSINVWVIAGDSFDSAISAHNPSFSMFVKHLTALSEIAPGLILQGTFSHDRPGSLDFIKNLNTKFPIHVADEAQQVALTVKDHLPVWRVINETSDYDSVDNYVPTLGVFSCLPSLNKADPTIMDVGARDYVRQLFTKWAQVNLQARRRVIPTALVTHGTVNGCLTESNYAMVSPDHEMDEITLYSAGTDAALLAHIHKKQSWTNGTQQIAYCGSLARLVHGHHDPVGFLDWTIETNNASWEFIETPSRQLLEITFDGPLNMAKLEELAKQVDADTSVRIRYQVDEVEAHSIDKKAIREMFAHAGELKIEGSVIPLVSVRAPGIGKAKNLPEKLAHVTKTMGQEEHLDELSERLQMVQSMSVDQIIEYETTQTAEQQEEAA